MEDPAREVEGVIRALIDKPTYKSQEQTLRRYFTKDVQFYHPLVNTNMGVEILIAIYQFAETLVNYSGVTLHSILYDPVPNCVAVRMTVITKPWLMPFRTIPLHFHTLLELEDVTENGKKLKRIKVQRDYFIVSPILQLIPVFGDIYALDGPRFVLGDLLALFVLLAKSFILSILRILGGKSKVDVNSYHGNL